MLQQAQLVVGLPLLLIRRGDVVAALRVEPSQSRRFVLVLLLLFLMVLVLMEVMVAMVVGVVW